MSTLKVGRFGFLILAFVFVSAYVKSERAGTRTDRIELLLQNGLPMGTYSIVAVDRSNGDLGVGVASKFLAAGSVVPYAKAGVGAVATQAFANPTFGPRGLKLMEEGLSAEDALKRLLAEDGGQDVRQVAVVDAKGGVAQWTGQKYIQWAGGIKGDGYAVQGNILVGEAVVQVMARAFESTKGELADRIMAALEAAQTAGGDSRGQQSAALLVVRKAGGFAGLDDRYIDLRVDDNPEPLKELRRLLELKHTQKHILKALGLAQDGKFEEAVREANLAIQRAPSDADLYFFLARIYGLKGDKKSAIESLRKAIKYNPKLRTAVKNDPAFEFLREETEYKQLVLP
jgi:uncharacterized Ntn-hydrolase superfamily protein